MNAKFWWIDFFRLSFILGLLGDWREHFFFSHFQVYTIIAFIHTETEAENYLIKGEFNQFGCQNSWPWSNALYVQFVGVFFSSHLDRDIQQIIDMQTIWVLFYFNGVGFLWGFFCQKSKWNLGNTMLSSNENFWTNVLFYLFNWSSRWTLKIQHQNGVLNRMPFEWVGFIMNGYGIRQPSHFVCGWRNKIVRLAYLGVEFSFSIHVLCFTGPNTLGFNSFSKWARHYQEMFCFNLCVIEVNEERFLKWKRQQNDTIKKKSIGWIATRQPTEKSIKSTTQNLLLRYYMHVRHFEFRQSPWNRNVSDIVQYYFDAMMQIDWKSPDVISEFCEFISIKLTFLVRESGKHTSTRNVKMVRDRLCAPGTRRQDYRSIFHRIPYGQSVLRLWFGKFSDNCGNTQNRSLK